MFEHNSPIMKRGPGRPFSVKSGDLATDDQPRSGENIGPLLITQTH
jgi:hypothetical protein